MDTVKVRGQSSDNGTGPEAQPDAWALFQAFCDEHGLNWGIVAVSKSGVYLPPADVTQEGFVMRLAFEPRRG